MSTPISSINFTRSVRETRDQITLEVIQSMNVIFVDGKHGDYSIQTIPGYFARVEFSPSLVNALSMYAIKIDSPVLSTFAILASLSLEDLFDEGTVGVTFQGLSSSKNARGVIVTNGSEFTFVIIGTPQQQWGRDNAFSGSF